MDARPIIEHLRPKPYFPQELKDVAQGRFKPFAEAPSQIPFGDTRLYDFVHRFRRYIDRKVVYRVKGQPDREERELEWGREYVSSISRTLTGFEEQTTPWEGEYQRFKNKLIGAAVLRLHNHPGPHPFSSSDFWRMLHYSVVKSRFQHSYKPVIEMISGDRGTFLAYPTLETRDITQQIDANEKPHNLIFDMISDELPPDEQDGFFRLEWAVLKSMYDLHEFQGNSLTDASKTHFPADVNVEGQALLQLRYNLLVTQVLKIPIYFAEGSGTVFNRLDKLEDYFPELVQLKKEQ